jgi:transposase
LPEKKSPMSTFCKVPSPDGKQYDLFGQMAVGEMKPKRNAADTGRRFVTGDPREIVLGTTGLQDYLKKAGQQAPFVVAHLLGQQDWSPFEQRYAATGRAPYAPRQMLGLILYGVMQGIHSLRQLERLARVDLGCMWVTGGIAPDHANIGRFIVLHEELLSQSFFESLTRAVLNLGGSDNSCLAGDGTVIEAACSHYKLLREEAVKARAEAAKAAVQNTPDDPQAQEQQQHSQHCQKVFEQRKAARCRSGRSSQTLCISVSEPDAMVQPLKRARGSTTSYKPSVLANEQRIITAHALDASSETKVIGPLLEQSIRVTGTKPQDVLLDAGYFNDAVIEVTLAHDISLLCPDGKWPQRPKDEQGLFHKRAFTYDESTNTYRCPAGQILTLRYSSAATPHSREHRQYATTACGDCRLRAKCTKTQEGRSVKRYPEDERREALRQVMQQRGARRVYCQRQAMVEPVFSHLRNQQGLDRFRRRGLQAVKREFALHVLAHNLSRAVALLVAALFFLLSAALNTLGRRFRSAVRFSPKPARLAAGGAASFLSASGFMHGRC